MPYAPNFVSNVLIPLKIVVPYDKLGLGWVRSAGDWAALRLLRNRMVHEYVSDAAILADALNAAHAGVPDLVASASAMAARVKRLAAGTSPGPGTESSA